MLIIKTYINERKIDEIHIQNVNAKLPKEDLYDYKIRWPKGFNKTIEHKRKDGYKILLIKALNEIIEQEKNKNG